MKGVATKPRKMEYVLGTGRRLLINCAVVKAATIMLRRGESVLGMVRRKFEKFAAKKDAIILP